MQVPQAYLTVLQSSYTDTWTTFHLTQRRESEITMVVPEGDITALGEALDLEIKTDEV